MAGPAAYDTRTPPVGGGDFGNISGILLTATIVGRGWQGLRLRSGRTPSDAEGTSRG